MADSATCPEAPRPNALESSSDAAWSCRCTRRRHECEGPRAAGSYTRVFPSSHTLLRESAHTDATFSIRPQLLDSAGSTDSNYRGACRGRSRDEFIAKVGVAAEEARRIKRLACGSPGRRVWRSSGNTGANPGSRRIDAHLHGFTKNGAQTQGCGRRGEETQGIVVSSKSAIHN